MADVNGVLLTSVDMIPITRRMVAVALLAATFATPLVAPAAGTVLDERVELSFGREPIEWLSYLLTLVGLAGVVWLVRRPPWAPDEEPDDGSPGDAPERWFGSGPVVFIISNQSGVARGLITPEQLLAVNAEVDAVLGPFDTWQVCVHDDHHQCACRKPLPGLFEQIGERFGVDLRTTPVVGDTPRDLVAGFAVGCQPHLGLGQFGSGLGRQPVTVLCDVGCIHPGSAVHVQAKLVELLFGPSDEGVRGRWR